MVTRNPTEPVMGPSKQRLPCHHPSPPPALPPLPHCLPPGLPVTSATAKMTTWMRLLASKSVLFCLLLLLLLTYMLQSEQRLPLFGENVLSGKEGGGGNREREGTVKNEDYLEFSGSSDTSEVIRKVNSVKQNDKVSALRPEPNLSVSLTVETPTGEPETWVGSAAETLTVTSKTAEESTAPRIWTGLTTKLLLLSSVGRSGSSFLGQLLAAQENSFYFYEPLRGIRAEYRDKDNTTAELLRYFNCNVRNTVLQAGSSPNMVIVHFQNAQRDNRVTLESVAEACRRKSIVILKTIRTRLEWIREFMHQKEFEDVKVIHLVRDPRGSYISIRKLQWKLSCEEMCDNINQDLQEKEVMKSHYPSRYIFVKYEDLCRDPYGQSRRLLHFIRGQGDEASHGGMETLSSVNLNSAQLDPKTYRDLPDGILDYLNRHMNTRRLVQTGPYTTVRNTSSMYQHWRWIITSKELKKVESVCRHVIHSLGHRMFSNLTAVRNASLSLFVSERL